MCSRSSPTADRAVHQELLPTIVDLAQKATGIAKPSDDRAYCRTTRRPAVSFMKPIRETEGEATDLGLTLTADEVYTPPLSDATTIDAAGPFGAAGIRRLIQSSNVPDNKLLVDTFNEFTT